MEIGGRIVEGESGRRERERMRVRVSVGHERDVRASENARGCQW